MVKDVDLFTAAMADVVPLKGAQRPRAAASKANSGSATKNIAPRPKVGMAPVRATKSMAQPLDR